MKVKIIKKVLTNIENDDQYIEAWEESNRLDGQASLICDIMNGDAVPSQKLSASLDRKRNKLIKAMNDHRQKMGWDEEKK